MTALTGCNPEARLAKAASGGDVEAQYELAIYYSELDKPQKSKSYDWMKRAAGSRYMPAMKKLAGYYLKGYGTAVDYPQAAEWLRRYFETNRNSEEALANAREILLCASDRKDVVAGFTLYRIAITLENQENRADSEISRASAVEMMAHTKKMFTWLLAARNYTDAKKLLDYSSDCVKDYPQTFTRDMSNQIVEMRNEFFKRIEE